jgi:uncharacterized protein YjbI with pentapeptide repeats
MEVLTSYIRKNSPIPSNIEQLKPEERKKALEKLPSVSIPVQAALTVIGRRKVENDQAGDNLAETTNPNKIKILDLSGTNLRGADLIGANLFGANLFGANLYGAKLWVAYLNGANLFGANLNRADLNRAKLNRANLNRANLYGAYLNLANLNLANLNLANLNLANLNLANLNGAYLNGANLNGAKLNGANLIGADLIGADLIGANLDGANLWGAEVDPKQIKSACFWESAIYTQGKWDEDKQLWVAADPKANQREIDKLKRDKNSDPPNPINCTTKYRLYY